MTTKQTHISRWKAAGVHLTISLALALGIGALLYLLWFPPPYFVATGAINLMLLVMGVDVVIGPALTLLVFNPAKSRRMLGVDLSIIGTLQAMAFVYGLLVICQARPIFVVAAVDRLTIVGANEVDDADLAKGSSPEFRRRSWIGPRLVGAEPAKGADAAKVVMQVVNGGKDIDQLPEYYVSYDDAAQTLLKRAHPLTALRNVTPTQRKQLQQLGDRAARSGDTLVYVPLQSRKLDFVAVLSTRSKRPVAVIAADPW